MLYKRNPFKLCLFLAFVFFTLKIIVYLYQQKYSSNFSETIYRIVTVNRFQCIFIGVIGAFLLHKKEPFFCRILSSRFTQFISWICFGCAIFNINLFPSVISQEIYSLFALSLILGPIVNGKRFFCANYSGLVFVGSISYGLYVYHPLVIFWISKIFTNVPSSPIGYFFTYVACAGTSLLVAFISYETIEKKFLKNKVSK